MQTSKDRILAVLKRHGQRSVDDLATALNLAPMTVRQHLTALERDELVSVAEHRNGAGRPRHIYSLTARGDAYFPRRYDRFARLLLGELGELERPPADAYTGGDRMSAVLERLAAREAAPHRERLGRLPLRERARAAAAVLHESGGFAEAVECEGGIEIRDYTCVYQGLRPEEAGPCAWHRRLLAQLLAIPAEDRTVAADLGRCCRWLVRCDSAPGETADTDKERTTQRIDA